MKKAIIYGLGQRYYIFEEWLYEEIKSDYCIVAVTDKDKNALGIFGNKFVPVRELVNIDFDVIIITSDRYFEEIFKELQNEYGISAGKIISMEELIDGIYREKFLLNLFSGKYGVEIGGPSSVFKNNIYEVCNRCDGVNYSADTVWWKTESSQYIYDGQKLGDVIISDVADLSIIEDEKYDFCISSNNLEHVANPIKALKEQKRIVKKGGLILVIVPMKSKCFDHNRDFTEFEHLLEDYTKQISEDDMTHLDEIMDKHDFDMDPACGGKEKFAQRAMKNYENRCLHHHVFNTDTLTNMYRFLDIKVLNAGRLKANYYIIGEK